MEKLDRMHCYHRRRRLEFFFLAGYFVPEVHSSAGHKRMRRNFNPSRYNFHVKWREFPANVCERICAIRRTTSVQVPIVLCWDNGEQEHGGINLWKGKNSLMTIKLRKMDIH